MSPKGILTEIYAKPTDDHTYLSPESNHPHYQYKGIVIGVAMRVRSITDDEFLNKHVLNYKAYLIKRGYDYILVNQQFYKYCTLSKLQCLKKWNPKYHIKLTPTELKHLQDKYHTHSQSYYSNLLMKNKENPYIQIICSSMIRKCKNR